MIPQQDHNVSNNHDNNLLPETPPRLLLEPLLSTMLAMRQRLCPNQLQRLTTFYVFDEIGVWIGVWIWIDVGVWIWIDVGVWIWIDVGVWIGIWIGWFSTVFGSFVFF
jgi:hypothetical protein